jgi:endo-1,4-beta-D-glucanase Y
MNQDVLRLYNDFKDRHLRGTPSGNRFICIAMQEQLISERATNSQAHGFGMIIFAQMAKHDPEARRIFDGMNQLRKAQPSAITPYLMSWQVFPEHVNNILPEETPITSSSGRRASATDGDLDMAYALLLAYRQWGDSTYKNEAITIINALEESCINHDIKRVKLGDWVTGPNSRTNTRTSDWIPGHFRAFATMTDNDSWQIVIDTVYSLLSQVSHSETGLMPTFATGTPVRPGAIGILDLVDQFPNHYWRDAGQVPFRLALDYVFYATPAAKYQINKISRWLREATDENPDRINSGYFLDGSVLPEHFSSNTAIAFIAPFASGMIADPDNQEFLNRTYDKIRSPNEDYNSYETAIQLLNMLLITGNWIDPVAESQIPSSIRRRQQTDNRHGIILENAIVSDLAKITVITPAPATVNLRILDNLGNVVWTATTVETRHALSPPQIDGTAIWNLTNPAGRFVANGTYLVIAEATEIVTGRVHVYHTRIGVRR